MRPDRRIGWVAVATCLLLLLPLGANPPGGVTPRGSLPPVAVTGPSLVTSPSPNALPGPTPEEAAVPAFDQRLAASPAANLPGPAADSLQRTTTVPSPAPLAPRSRPDTRPLDNATNGSFQSLYSLDLANGTLTAGGATSVQQAGAEYSAYDPANGLLYVSSGGYEIRIIDPGRFVQVGSFNASVPAGALTYDPIDRSLLVESDGVVAAIDPGTLALLYTIVVPAASAGEDGTLVLDEVQDSLWVTNPFSENVSVVNLTRQTVVAERHVGIGFNDILSGVYDPLNGRVYLDYYENGTVEVFNASSLSRLANVNLSAFCCFSWGLGLDPVTGTVYVTVGLYGWGSYLVAISNRTDVATGSLSIGGFPSGVAYDPTTGDLYVADAAKSRVTVVDPANLSIVARLSLPQEAPLIAGQLFPVDVPALGTIDVATDYGFTVDAISTTNSSATRVIDTYAAPRAMTYDAACGCGVVTDAQRDLVEFVDPATMGVLFSRNLSGEPYGIVYDPASSTLWVTIGGLFSASAIEVLNGSNGGTVATIPGGDSPWGIAYDPVANEMFVANYLGTNVSVYNASNRSLTAQISVGDSPEGIAFDPLTGAVYVAVFGADELSEIDPATDAVVGTAPVPNYPTQIAIDNGSGTVYVAELLGDTLAVNATSLSELGSVPVAYVTGFAWDPSAQAVLAFNETGTLAVLNGTSLGVTDYSVGVATADGAWAGGSGLLVADAATGDLLLVGSPGLDLDTNFTLRVSPEVGAVGIAVTVSWTYSGDIGPSGLGWGGSATVGFTESGVGPTGPLTFILDGPGILNTHFKVEFPNGQAFTGNLTFAAIQPVSVTFNETGLGPNGTWYVALAGGPYAVGGPGSIDFPLVDGTYAFQIGSFSAGYEVLPAVGLVRVNGDALSVAVQFVPVFQVTVDESGLSNGSNWSIDVGGVVHSSSASAISFPLGNGSYLYQLGLVPGFASASGAGTLVVAGAPVELTFAFHRVTYLVTFSETGLIPGTVWWLYLGWLSDPYWSTENSSVSFTLANGSYTYFYYSVVGYRLTQPGTALTVDGGPVNVSATYAAPPDSIFLVSFEESGLPNGSTWSVDFAGRTGTSNASSIVFPSFNGTWSFTVSGVAGHLASPTTGTVTVNGAAENVSVFYAPTLYTVTFSAFGRPPDGVWTVSLGTSATVTANAQVEFHVPNGTYPFRVTGLPGYRAEGVGAVGTISVDGSPQLLSVDFVRGPTAEISFTRTGLATGTEWCVAMVGVATCSTEGAIHFRGLTPGDYPYALLSPTQGQSVTARLGALPVGSSGIIDLGSRSVTVAFKFVYRYFVTFSATGLPSGAVWSVRFEGSSQSTNASEVVFAAANGSSGFHLTPPVGYRVVATPSHVRVDGASVVVVVTFHPTGRSASPSSTTEPVPVAVDAPQSGPVVAAQWRS